MNTVTSRLIDATKPYQVRTGCGHIVIRRMREATAGVPYTPETIIEAPNGRYCDGCEEIRLAKLAKAWSSAPSASQSQPAGELRCLQERQSTKGAKLV